MVKPMVWLAATAVLFAAAPVGAQSAANAPAGEQQPAAPARGTAPITVCGTQVSPPSALPPAGSKPVLWQLAPCFEAQGNVSLVDIQTYLYYIQLQPHVSKPSEGTWKPYDDNTEKIIVDDFKRLWATSFLDNL